jgi:hypothetical protein
MQSRITVLKYLNLRNGTAAQGEEKRISLPLHRRWSKSIDAARGRNPLSSSQGVRKPWEGIHRGFTCRPWRAWGSGAGLAGGLGAALLLAFARAAGAAFLGFAAAPSLDPIGTVGIDRCVRLRGLDSINREHEVMLDAWRRAWSEHVRLPPLNFTTSLH